MIESFGNQLAEDLFRQEVESYARVPPDLLGVARRKVLQARSRPSSMDDPLADLPSSDGRVQALRFYRYRPVISRTRALRQRDQSEKVKAIAWKAQHRLHARYRKLVDRGKSNQQAVTAVGRELIGFIGAIGMEAERDSTMPTAIAG